jgi:hypothetical protein
LIVSAAKTYVA